MAQDRKEAACVYKSTRGRVNLGNGQVSRGIPFRVAVSGEDPAPGLCSSPVGAFEGMPGDTISGNGNYDLPVETVATGQIATGGAEFETWNPA